MDVDFNLDFLTEGGNIFSDTLQGFDFHMLVILILIGVLCWIVLASVYS